MATIVPMSDLEAIPENLNLPTIQAKLKSALPTLVNSDNRISELLEARKAGLEDTLDVVSQLMHYGTQDDAVRLRATELSLRLHRVLRDESDGRGYNFSFVIQGGDVNIQQILQPSRV